MNWLSTTCWFLLISLAPCFLHLVSGKTNQTADWLSVHIEYVDNHTLMLYYNLTTNYSYYLTFRLFEHDQIRFGLFPPTYRYQQKSLRISNQSNSREDTFHLFIVCFHFISRVNDIDIQCKDIRSSKPDNTNVKEEKLLTYKPLFVPLMYALSILMLLPMIIQHRRQKRALLLERRKQLRRLSLSIAPDNPDILSQMVENGEVNFKKIPIQIELVALPSTKAVLDDTDDNDNVTFTLQNLQSYCESDEQGEPGVSADDCIAHLLDSRPWHSHPMQQSPMFSAVKRESRNVLHNQQIPVITILNGGEHADDDDNNGEHSDDDQRPILKSSAHQTVELFSSNPTFSDVDI